MRHDASELDQFPKQGAINISVELIRRLSPDSLSVMEFKSDKDVRIAEKMLKFPMLGDAIREKWSVRFIREFDMTNDSDVFKTSPAANRLTLYEGKMIWLFAHGTAEPR